MTATRTTCAAPARAPRAQLLAPGVYDALTALIAEQAGFEALYLSGGADRLHAARPLGRRPDHRHRNRRRAGAHHRPRGAAADRRRRHRLRQRAEHAAHGARSSSAPAPRMIQLEDQDLPEALRPPGRQELVRTHEMCGKLKAALDARHIRRHADPGAHRRRGRRRARGRLRARRSLRRVRRRRAVHRGAAHAGRHGRRLRPLRRARCRCWRTWSKAARRRCRARTNWAARLSHRHLPGRHGALRRARSCRRYFGSLHEHGTTAPMRDRCSISTASTADRHAGVAGARSGVRGLMASNDGHW